MAYIKKLKDNELIGGTDNTDVYPVTSTEAVYNRENVSQEYINNHVDGSKIVGGTITTSKIADNAVAMGKLDNEVQTLIQQGADSSWTPKGDFNIETTYDANDVVFDPVTNSSYLSLRADNTGHPVDENDEEYEEGWWMKVLDGSYVNRAIEEMEAAIAQAIEDAQEDISELISDSQATINAAVSGANTAAQSANTAAQAATTAKNTLVEEISQSLAVYETVADTIVTDPEAATGMLPVQNYVLGKAIVPMENYIHGNIRSLAVGQVYTADEAVRVSDGSLARMTKETKKMTTTDIVVKGDLKIANSKTYKALKDIAAYNGYLNPYYSGDYAVGSPSIYTITVDTVSMSQGGGITVTVGSNTVQYTVVDGDTATTIAAAIANGLDTLYGWIITDNEDGTITIACATGGANTLTISSDTGDTGVEITSATTATGAAAICKYNGSTWSTVTVANMYGDSALYEEVPIATLISNYTSQNSVTKDLQAQQNALIRQAKEQDDMYEELVLNATPSASAYGYCCIHTHYYNNYIWTACCTNDTFRLYRDGTQVKSIGSRNLAGVFVTNGYVYSLTNRGTLYKIELNTYTEASIGSITMPSISTGNNRFFASFCLFKNKLHFVLSERSNIISATSRFYVYNGSSITYINSINASSNNSGVALNTDGTYIYATYCLNRTMNYIYRCDSSYSWQFVDYAVQLGNTGQDLTSCISLGNKYPIIARGTNITLWNNNMPVRISLNHFAGGTAADVSIDVSGNYIYLATFIRAATATIRVYRLKKDYFDNFFDCKPHNEIYITSPSQLVYGQSGIMSYHGRVFEYSTGGGTQQRDRYAPYGVKDIVRVKATGTGYNKYMMLSQGECYHQVRVFTSRKEENIFHSEAFRIPTLCKYGDVLYAGCSARLTGSGDTVPADAVVARSYDGGLTWQNYTKATTHISGGTDKDANLYVCGGGTKAGRLWVFADRYDNTSGTLNANYKFIGCYSDDGGLTWSTPVDYLPSVISAAASAGYTISYCRTSSGSGVTLANGTLVISIALYVSGRQAAALWYTTDGTNWQLGDILPNDESNESALTLVGNGIYMTYRMNSGRGFAKLTSIGSGWTKITTATNPNGNSSDITVGWGYCNGVFLLSCPYSSNRNNISLYKSKDLVTWERVKQLTSSNDHAANLMGYTCIVFTQDTLKIFVEMKSVDLNVFDFDYLLPYIFK